MGVFPALPIPKIPGNPIVPVIRPVASRENVAHPLPGVIARLDSEEKTEKRDGKKEIADQVFDGRPAPERKPVVVVPGRTIGLPEMELEKEIGAY